MLDNEIVSQVTGETPSTIHHTLRASRRRLVVLLLAHRSIANRSQPSEPVHNGTSTATPEVEITARHLAREIVAIEENIERTQATGDIYHNAYTALTQTHLPQLDAISAIQYHQNRKTVLPSHNLLPLAIIATQSSTIAQMIFHDSVARLFTAGKSQKLDAIDD